MECFPSMRVRNILCRERAGANHDVTGTRGPSEIFPVPLLTLTGGRVIRTFGSRLSQPLTGRGRGLAVVEPVQVGIIAGLLVGSCWREGAGNTEGLGSLEEFSLEVGWGQEIPRVEKGRGTRHVTNLLGIVEPTSWNPGTDVGVWGRKLPYL